MPRILFLLLLALVVVVLAANAQNAADEEQVDPSAQCAQDVRDKITSCLDVVETDESKLSGGPCTSSDWKCICTKQQGMVDCYSPCPGLQPVDMLNFNKNSCKGQHGVTIRGEGGDLTYTWSSLPFTSTATSSPDTSNSTSTNATTTSSTDSDAGNGELTSNASNATSSTTSTANSTALSSSTSSSPSSSGDSSSNGRSSGASALEMNACSFAAMGSTVVVVALAVAML